MPFLYAASVFILVMSKKSSTFAADFKLKYYVYENVSPTIDFLAPLVRESNAHVLLLFSRPICSCRSSA